jgi:hypothetical protein
MIERSINVNVLKELHALYTNLVRISYNKSAMKIYVLLLTMIMTVNSVFADKPLSQPKVDVLLNPVLARSLADACEIVRLINELEWVTVKKKLNKGNQVGILIIEPQSKIKNWHGLGAYRGSEIDTENQKVKHRFSYGGGRKAFHEVWITYSYRKDGFDKPSVEALGW